MDLLVGYVGTALLLPSCIWMIGACRELMRRRANSRQEPSVTVVVVGRNEAKFIVECLEAVLSNDYPAEKLQVIFVDDHSNDGTLELARGVAMRYSEQLVTISAPTDPATWGPKKRAQFHALQRTTGEVILFTDADCVVPKLWIQSMVKDMDERTDAVVGLSMPPRAATFASQVYELERLLVNTTLVSASGWNSVASACGHSIAVRKSALEKIGFPPYPEHPSGDDDLTVQAVSRTGARVGCMWHAEGVVLDTRPAGLRQQIHASVRHQSTVKFYPMGWRLLYGATIVSNLMLYGLLIGAFFFSGFWLAATLMTIAKVLIDILPARLLSRRIGRPITWTKLALASLFLPVYLGVRSALYPAAAYTWRGRTFGKNESRTSWQAGS